MLGRLAFNTNNEPEILQASPIPSRLSHQPTAAATNACKSKRTEPMPAAVVPSITLCETTCTLDNLYSVPVAPYVAPSMWSCKQTRLEVTTPKGVDAANSWGLTHRCAEIFTMDLHYLATVRGSGSNEP